MTFRSIQMLHSNFKHFSMANEFFEQLKKSSVQNVCIIMSSIILFTRHDEEVVINCIFTSILLFHTAKFSVASTKKKKKKCQQ